jgi:hypothetical protein
LADEEVDIPLLSANGRFVQVTDCPRSFLV